MFENILHFFTNLLNWFFSWLTKDIIIVSIIIPILYWLLRLIYQKIMKRMIIYSFWLSHNQSYGLQPYELIQKNQYNINPTYLYITSDPLPLYAYNFPEFEILFKNNKDNSLIMDDFYIRVNEVRKSQTLFIWLDFEWNTIFDKNEKSKLEYSDLIFKINNLSHFPVENMKIVDFYAQTNKWLIQKDDFIFENNVPYINKEDSFTVTFSLKNKQNELGFINIYFSIEWEFNKQTINRNFCYSCEWLLYYDEKVWFYMYSWELWCWAIEVEKFGKFLLPIKENCNNKNFLVHTIEWLKKRYIRSNDIDSFTFSLWTDYPCVLDIDIIFIFWTKKVQKNLIIDFSYPTSFDIDSFIEESYKMEIIRK